jgi:hypothetical protein
MANKGIRTRGYHFLLSINLDNAGSEDVFSEREKYSQKPQRNESIAG